MQQGNTVAIKIDKSLPRFYLFFVLRFKFLKSLITVIYVIYYTLVMGFVEKIVYHDMNDFKLQ